MAKRKTGLSDPSSFGIHISPPVALVFRRYCAIDQVMIGPLIEELIIEHLKKNGYAKEMEEIERGDNMDPNLFIPKSFSLPSAQAKQDAKLSGYINQSNADPDPFLERTKLEDPEPVLVQIPSKRGRPKKNP